MTGYVTMIVIILALTEAYCADWIVTYCKDKAEEKAEKRRAVYRRKAYDEVYARRTINSNRYSLWRSIEK